MKLKKTHKRQNNRNTNNSILIHNNPTITNSVQNKNRTHTSTYSNISINNIKFYLNSLFQKKNIL